MKTKPVKRKTRPTSVGIPQEMEDKISLRLKELGEMKFTDYVLQLIRADVIRGGDFSVVKETGRKNSEGGG
jgi:hypothetical protein